MNVHRYCSANPGTGNETGTGSLKDYKCRREPIKAVRPFALYRMYNTCSCCRSKRNASLDASKGMVAWAKENVASSGLSDKPIGSLL
ncbi:MAG: hypothetical protein ACLU6Y_10035 [Ruminococcus sp.]